MLSLGCSITKPDVILEQETVPQLTDAHRKDELLGNQISQEINFRKLVVSKSSREESSRRCEILRMLREWKSLL